jgi:transcriptional regulator GlxA family with amidase domain
MSRSDRLTNLRKKSRTIHVVIWFPGSFYSAVAATIVEILELVNDLRRSKTFTFEFVSNDSPARSTSGITFPASGAPSRKMDVLILLAMPGIHVPNLLRALEAETAESNQIIGLAKHDGAVIAAHCGGCYLLASSGALDGKRATISWWLKGEAIRRFPKVRWEPSRVLIRHGDIYTCGGGFSGLELAKALLDDLGFAKEAQIVRKLLLLPPSRKFQSPYEFALEELSPQRDLFARKIDELARKSIAELDLPLLADELGLSARTLSRRFHDTLNISPGRWIQEKRLQKAKALLEKTRLSVSEICFQVGYEDVASFSRLFSKSTGMAPGEFRRQAQS